MRHGVKAEGPVRLGVEDEGAIVLEYVFGDLREATAMIAFLRPFFPRGRFVLEMAVH